jgi:hypothetical protein
METSKQKTKLKKKKMRELQIMSLISVVKIKFINTKSTDESPNYEKPKRSNKIEMSEEDKLKLVAIKERLKLHKKNNDQSPEKSITLTHTLPNLDNANIQPYKDKVSKPVNNLKLIKSRKIPLPNQLNSQPLKLIWNPSPNITKLPDLNAELKPKKIVLTAPARIQLTKTQSSHTFSSYEEIKQFHKYNMNENTVNGRNKNKLFTVSSNLF